MSVQVSDEKVIIGPPACPAIMMMILFQILLLFEDN
jgi:hypothetical protein